MCSLAKPRAWMLALVVGCLPLAGCGEGACTMELRSNLLVEVRDSATGAPAAWGATGSAQHEVDRATELYAMDSLRLVGNWQSEQAGRYEVTVRKPGFTPVHSTVNVDEGSCHVKTRTVRVTLPASRDDWFQPPVFFTPGERVPGWNASAGFAVRGDTLVISGRATAPCSQVTAVASRTRWDWHIQLQPEQWATGACGDYLQQFSLGYLLAEGTTHVYLTNARGLPVVLFDATVTVP